MVIITGPYCFMWFLLLIYVFFHCLMYFCAESSSSAHRNSKIRVLWIPEIKNTFSRSKTSWSWHICGKCWNRWRLHIWKTWCATHSGIKPLYYCTWLWKGCFLWIQVSVIGIMARFLVFWLTNWSSACCIVGHCLGCWKAVWIVDVCEACLNYDWHLFTFFLMSIAAGGETHLNQFEYIHFRDLFFSCNLGSNECSGRLADFSMISGLAAACWLPLLIACVAFHAIRLAESV